MNSRSGTGSLPSVAYKAQASPEATTPPSAPFPRANPYVGPRPFRADEYFFGREREASAVVNSLLSSRVMLLHSPSGAGKTSLIQTSVVPAFATKRDFLICATTEPEFSALRVNLPLPDGLPGANPYVFSVVNGLLGDISTAPGAGALTLPDALDEFVRRHGRGDRQLLVIDQLEEVLTLDPGDIEGQSEFFRQLGQALDNSRRWALLAIREDYMGGLDRFRQYLPGQLRSTFRLDFLDVTAARKAVQEPARKVDVTFGDAAAGLLVDELRKVHSGNAFEETPSLQYPYVEPVLLQVVCYSLFEKLAKQQGDQFAEITYADVDDYRPFSKSIRKYYRTVLREVAREDREVEQKLRDWVEHHLIGKGGLRRQSRRKPDVPNPEAVLGELGGRYHLIRDDPRPGGTPLWELSHDMLVRPIREDNRAWRTKNLARWQVLAEDWRASDQDKRYLLAGADYLGVPPPRRRSELSQAEQLFLAASDENAAARRRATRLKIQLWLWRIGLAVSVLLNVVFAILLFVMP